MAWLVLPAQNLKSKPSGPALSTTAQNPPSTPPMDFNSKINIIQSNKGKYQKQPGSKKKGKGKKKKYSPP